MQLNPALTALRALPADPAWADQAYRNEVKQGSRVWPQVRQNPCQDCAVMCGLYTEIAVSCYQNLESAQLSTVANGWFCHNGGRCEGAWQVLVGEGDVA